MPDLLASLNSRDMGFLRICASLWDLELKSSVQEKAAEELAKYMLKPQAVKDLLSSLPPEVVYPLQAIIQAGGRLSWAVFTRQWGQVRHIGPGRRDREQVHLQPVSTAEILLYHSLVANAFFDSPSGLQEFAYIPEDLLPVLQRNINGLEDTIKSETTKMVPGRPATSRECTRVLPASDRLLDDVVTLLAAMRVNVDPTGMIIPVDVVAEFLRSAGILQGNDPSPDKVKEFLELPPDRSLALLTDMWQRSDGFNELRQVPGLLFEGEWQNHPQATRRFLLGLLQSIPEEKWWSLNSLVAFIKEKSPDFQRPAGQYDSWYIKRTLDGSYLRGFGTWDEVDGALVRYFITGPLFWLGQVDLARVDESGEILAFRRRKTPPTRQETARLSVSSNGTISILRLVPRFVRYQVSRFCDWRKTKGDEYRYQATISSLQRAVGQGLKINHLLSLLAKHAGAELPPAFITALKRWETQGTEARLQSQLLLRLSRPEVLEELRQSKAGRFLGEVIGPTTVVVKPGAEEKVVAALWNLGIIAEMRSLD